ncbi:MAG TPA: hypothetical protein VG318_12045 [Actinomycetota bacterium]|nr:hypothetical protein [Actinomycetota bacterium]
MRGRLLNSAPLCVCALLLAQLALPARALAPPAAPSLAASVDPRLHDWIRDPFVRQALTSSDFAKLEARLRRIDGYLGAYPETSGKYLAYWEGPVPTRAPRLSPGGHEVRHMGHAQVEPLIARGPAGTSAISLQDLERRVPALAADPQAPGPVQGIGPGGAIRMPKVAANGRVSTFICSASYVFHNPATDVYYLATAGHCLLDEEMTDSTRDPDARAQSVQLCYADCVNNYFGLGEYVELRPDDAYPGYHPVAWAEARGPGHDFGFIEIPRSLNPLLRPSLWFWGGPTGFERPGVGAPIVHYGFGSGLGQVLATQGRAGVTIFSSKEEGQGAVGWVNGGDSGSAFGTVSPRLDEMLVGDGATGTITHGVTGVGLPLMWGTDIEYALDQSQTALGVRLLLVTEDGTTQDPSPSPAPTASPAPSPSPAPDEPPDAGGPAERAVSLRSSRSAIRPGESVSLRGSISSSGGCLEDQPVNGFARNRSQERFRSVGQTTSAVDGRFAIVVRPRSTRSYRVVVPANEECARAVSRIVTVSVRR